MKEISKNHKLIVISIILILTNSGICGISSKETPEGSFISFTVGSGSFDISKKEKDLSQKGKASTRVRLGIDFERLRVYGAMQKLNFNKRKEYYDFMEELSLDIFLRKSRLKPFLGASLGYLYASEITPKMKLIKVRGIAFGGNIGLIYQLNYYLGMEIGFKYFKIAGDQSKKIEAKNFSDVYFGFNFRI
jgi:hypothetical protein